MAKVRPTRRPFFFRLPDDLRKQLDHEAERAERSLGAELVFRLRASLEKKRVGHRTPAQRVIADIHPTAPEAT